MQIIHYFPLSYTDLIGSATISFSDFFAFVIDKPFFLLYNTNCRLTRQFATVAQLVEQLIRNQQVRGSSPLSSCLEPLIFKGFFVFWE